MDARDSEQVRRSAFHSAGGFSLDEARCRSVMESYGRKRWREDRRDSPRHSGLWSGDGARTRDGGGVEMQSDAPDSPVASTIIFGSNLISDPCATCNYSDGGGYALLGPDNCYLPGTTQWLAGTFVALATGVPKQISVPIVLKDPASCPTNTVTVSIYTDACYPTGPGTPLVSATATVPEAACALTVAKLPNSAPVLTRGRKYWVVATTNAQQVALNSNWYGSNNDQEAVNTGTGWQRYTGGTPAFMVEGSGINLAEALTDAAHAAFGSNLFVDPCTGCNYNSNSPGFDVRGPSNCTNPGMLHWEAVPFIAGKSGVPRRISAPIIVKDSVKCPYDKVTLSLYTDNCDVGPDTPLVSGIATVPTAPCDMAVARLRDAPALTQGVKYWVVATTSDQQAGLDATWYGSNVAQYALSPGYEWIQFSTATPAFLVQ